MVEDLSSDAELIKREIKKSGIQFIYHIVETKKDYIQALQDFNPNIILSDYSLPNFNGMQALLIREELAPAIPFILVTGSINEETAVEVMKFGADDYVIKEHISRIGSAILTALEKKKVIRLKNKAEESLKVLSRAVEQNPATIVITDVKGEIEYVNPKFTQLTGYSLDEALGQNPRILKSGKTSPEEYKHLWETITSGKEWHGEFQNRKKNGDIYLESASISPITDEKGNITHFLAVKEDITERKQAEEFLKNLINKNPLSIQIVDAEGYTLQTNAAHTKLFGAVPPPDYSIFKDKQIMDQGFVESFDRIKAGEDVKFPDFYFNIHDIYPELPDKPIWLRLVIFSLFDKIVNQERFVLMHEDITERKLAEDALRRSRKEFQNYFDSNSIGLSVTAPDKTWIEVNQRLCKIFGYSKEELIGLTWVDLSHPDDLSANLALFQQAMDGKIDNYELDKRFIRKDGSIAYITLSVVCQRNDDGSVHHFLSSYLDITARKEVEKRVELLAHSLESISECVSITDNDDIIIYVNESFIKTFGYSEKELIGKNINILRPSGLEDLHTRDILQETIKGSWQGELTNKRKDGSLFPVLLSTSVVKDENGKPIALIGVAIDITERKKLLDDLVIAKEKAEESDRLKTAFLHNISHEIRTPMNAIVGFSEFLTEPGLNPEKQNHFTGIIVQSSNQLLSIITDIISIATIEAGQEKINENKMNLNSICKLINEQFLTKAQSQNVTLLCKTTLPDNEANIITDETKLTQILTNLVGNALKFTKQGQVDFGYEVKGNQLEFYVKDTGIGIPPEMHDEIFKRFRQVETTTTRQFGGSGLGLSISKAHIELLGGKIWLTSELGKGSTFYFTLPLKVVSSQKFSEKQSLDRPKNTIEKSKTILIAEDQDSNFMLLEELLLGLNIIIIRALNGLEAVEMCKNQQIDLILMDIKMPEMDGYQATKRIKEFLPNIPIIAQTAYTMNEEKERALQAGCDNYLTKPFKKADLLAMISKYGGE